MSADATEAFASGSSPSTAIKVDGAEEFFEELDIDKILEVNSVICIEKEIAADTIGGLFGSTGTHFLPYVEECTVELIGQLTHYYDGIRKSSLESLLEIVQTMYELSNPSEWQPGLENVSNRSVTAVVIYNGLCLDPSLGPDCEEPDRPRFTTVVRPVRDGGQ